MANATEQAKGTRNKSKYLLKRTTENSMLYDLSQNITAGIKYNLSK